MRHLAILTLTILLSVVTLSALAAPLTQPGDPRLPNRQPTTSSQGSIKLTKPPIASITAPGTLVVLHPTQSATGSGLANLRSPATKQVISVAAMRTKWSQVQEVKDAKASPNSGSAEVSPGHLDVNLPPGVELRSAISRADLVFTDFARWTNPGGGVTIGAQGLTAGAVYALGCAFMSVNKGDTIQFNMGNQTTTLTATSTGFGDSVAFIAPPEGKISISIKPSSSEWYWFLCKVATVS